MGMAEHAGSADSSISSPSATVRTGVPLRTRSFGPARSQSTATGRPASASAARTIATRGAMSGHLRCEALSRKQSTPASMRARTPSGLAEAGPRVATILTFRGWVVCMESSPPHGKADSGRREPFRALPVRTIPDRGRTIESRLGGGSPAPLPEGGDPDETIVDGVAGPADPGAARPRRDPGGARRGAANPLLSEWKTPFGVPPFAEIKPEHFLPAIEAGHGRAAEGDRGHRRQPGAADVRQHRRGARGHAASCWPRSSSVFQNLVGAETNEQLQAISRKTAPMLAAHRDDITSTQALFARVKAVWEARGVR